MAIGANKWVVATGQSVLLCYLLLFFFSPASRKRASLNIEIIYLFYGMAFLELNNCSYLFVVPKHHLLRSAHRFKLKCEVIRSIIVGYVWCRLAAKCACAYATAKLVDFVSALYKSRWGSGGCEAAVHAARRFVDSMGEEQVFVKLDFANAFNCLHRDPTWMTLPLFAM